MKALILGLIAAGLILFFGTAEDVLPDGNLVLHFNFDEGRGDKVEDLSGNGNNGEIKGEAKWVDGKFRKALEFDGKTGYVEVPDSDSLDITKAVTIEAWVKSNADHPGYTGLVRKGNLGGDRPNNYMLQIKPDGPGGADLIQLVYSHASGRDVRKVVVVIEAARESMKKRAPIYISNETLSNCQNRRTLW